jgi:hypothetical protein
MLEQKWPEVFIFNSVTYFISILFNIMFTCDIRAYLYANLLSIQFLLIFHWFNRIDFL